MGMGSEGARGRGETLRVQRRSVGLRVTSMMASGAGCGGREVRAGGPTRSHGRESAAERQCTAELNEPV